MPEELRNLYLEGMNVSKEIAEFGEAVCAFANDMPDCDKPGYIF